MVRLPALITEYARLDGRPRSTIAWYARLAREAGKLPTTKRGLGASHMGIREAVNLILACNGAEDPKEGADAIDRFRSYKGISNDIEEIENDEMRQIGLQPNLGNALEELVRLAPYLFKTFEKILSLSHTNMSTATRLHIIASTPCVKLDKWGATIWFGSDFFLGYDAYLEDKNQLRMEYRKTISFNDSKEMLNTYRLIDVTLELGMFMELANLLLEDSMQFPDELIPQLIGGSGDA